MLRFGWVLSCVSLVACGARSSLRVPDGDAAADAARDVVLPDAPIDTPPVMACTTAWNACRPLGPGIDVSQGTLAQSPDVAWTGREILIVFDSSPGNSIVALSPTGDRLWRESIGGIQSPRVVWHRRANAGLVLMDSYVQWLGADARPVGGLVDAHMEGSQLWADAAPIENGFLIFSGVLAYSTPPALSRAIVGTTPGAIVWEHLADGAPRSPPERAIGDDGLGHWFVSTVWHSSVGEAYPISADGRSGGSISLNAVMPPDGHVCGVAEREGFAEVLIGTTGPTLMLVRVPAGIPVRAGPIPFRSPRSGRGHLIRMGADTVLLAAEESDRASGVQVAPVERDGTTGVPLLVGPMNTQSPRMAATDRGFVIVWNQSGPDGLATWAQIFECCER